MPISQLTPSHPGKHRQSYLSSPSTHEPPFWQGLLKQVCATEKKPSTWKSKFVRTLSILAIMFRPFGFKAYKTLNYFAFQPFEFEHNRWRLFQKRVVRTISTFSLLSLGRYLCWWNISPRMYHLPSSQCFYHWVDTSAGGILVPECIICPIVSVSITGSIPLLVEY